MTSIHTDVKSICRRATLMTADGRLENFEAVVHPDAVNRDDVGTGMQLGWTPPTPLYLLRMVLAKRRARRSGT